MTAYVLGLDLGSNSVGWAAIAKNGDAFANGLPAFAGVRVFPEGVEQPNTSKEKPRGQDRRIHRGQRRLLLRRHVRKQRLRRVLQAAGICAEGFAPGDPYALRRDGLDRKLTLPQLARALMHLCQRRGYKSNRKSKSEKDGVVHKATVKLGQDMAAAGARTLGEYLHGLAAGATGADLVRLRNRYTLRSMYEQEFEAIWSAQTPHYPQVLTEEVKAQAFNAIFYQRPLRGVEDRVGDCELEPGQKRCPRGHWAFQQFRLLQDVNSLRIIDAYGEERFLTQAERTTLVEALTPKNEMTFDDIRELLGFGSTTEFNFETRSKIGKLKGNAIEASLRKKEFAKWYAALGPQQRQDLYEALAHEEDEQALRARAIAEWGASEAQADRLLKIPVPDGRAKVSLAAINRIMPYLQPDHVHDERCAAVLARRGVGPTAPHVYADARELAGYGYAVAGHAADSLAPVNRLLPHLTNPLVHRAMSEARKVVNALLRELGRPDEIVIELARDMKHSAEKRRELHFDNLKRRDENDAIRSRLIAEFNISNPSRDDVIKYKLWKECGGECPYTGRTIPTNKLFTGEIQIEHILPYSRTLDDSFMNKSLCYEDENRRKHNRTPFEVYGGDPAAYERLQQSIARLPYPKRRKFLQKEIDLEGCVQRQLNDTRYISRAAADYFRTLYDNPQAVRCVKGGTTAELRHQWGLDEILGLRGEKNRLDHRHHAVDAAVIAMTTRSSLQRLSQVKYAAERAQLDKPWERFRDDLAATVAAINVSHRPSRKLAGSLHEDTGLGPTATAGEYARTVPLERLTPAQIESIRDPVVKRLVSEAQAAGKLGKEPLRMPCRNGLGPLIKKVRVVGVEKTAIPIRRNAAGQPDKFVLPGGNHHVEIYAKPDGTWTGRAISRFEAHQRLRQGRPVIDRSPQNGMTFVMSLSNNDMVTIDWAKGSGRALSRVQNLSVSSPVAFLRLHTATKTDDDDPITKAARQLVSNWESFRKLRPQKVAIDLIGRIRPCND